MTLSGFLTTVEMFTGLYFYKLTCLTLFCDFVAFRYRNALFFLNRKKAEDNKKTPSRTIQTTFRTVTVLPTSKEIKFYSNMQFFFLVSVVTEVFKYLSWVLWRLSIYLSTALLKHRSMFKSRTGNALTTTPTRWTMSNVRRAKSRNSITRGTFSWF